MNEERIIQVVGTMIGKLNQKITRLDKNVTKLDKKIDTVSQDLKSFKEETNTGINNLKEELNSFEEETRENFVSMSSMSRNTNERITELDKKIDKKFEENYRVVGDILNSAFESIDRNYVKKSKVVS